MFEHEEGPTVKEVFLDFRSQGVAAEQIGDFCRDPSFREHVARILQWHVTRILQWHMTRIVIRVTLIRVTLIRVTLIRVTLIRVTLIRIFL